MIYGANAMIPVEVNSLAWRRLNIDEDLNKEGLNNSADFIEKIRRMAHIRE